MAVVQATTIGILTVLGPDDECIGYVRCMDDGSGDGAYRVKPWATLSGVVGPSTSLASEAAIADALRSLRAEGRTRAVVIDASGRRLAVLSTAPIAPATGVSPNDFATEWDARLD